MVNEFAKGKEEGVKVGLEIGKQEGREEFRIKINERLKICQERALETSVDKYPTLVLILFDRLNTLRELLGEDFTVK